MPPVLWRTLPNLDQRQLSGRFIRLDPDDIVRLSDEDFNLFAQWVYGRQYNRMAFRAIDCRVGVDFVFDDPEAGPELLRVYPGEQVTPAMLYDVLETAKGTSYRKIRVYIRAPASEAAKQLQRQFPLAFEMLNLDGLKSRLADIKRTKANRQRWRAQWTSSTKTNHRTGWRDRFVNWLRPNPKSFR